MDSSLEHFFSGAPFFLVHSGWKKNFLLSLPHAHNMTVSGSPTGGDFNFTKIAPLNIGATHCLQRFFQDEPGGRFRAAGRQRKAGDSPLR